MLVVFENSAGYVGVVSGPSFSNFISERKSCLVIESPMNRKFLLYTFFHNNLTVFSLDKFLLFISKCSFLTLSGQQSLVWQGWWNLSPGCQTNFLLKGIGVSGEGLHVVFSRVDSTGRG